MRAALVLSSFALAGLFAAAQPARAEEKTCRQQIEELCPNTSPNTPERRECVQKGMDKLTGACQQQLGHVKALGAPTQPTGVAPNPPPPPIAGTGSLQDLVKACSKDHPRMVELCQKGQKPGENPLPCLVEHIGEFSESCQQWIRDAEVASAKAAPGAASAPKPDAASHGAAKTPAKPPTATK